MGTHSTYSSASETHDGYLYNDPDKPLYVATKQGEGEVSVNYLQES